MPVAYTPGLVVSADVAVTKSRRLPIKGEVLVAAGQRVTGDAVVARAELPGDLTTVKAVDALGVEPGEVAEHLTRQPGEAVAEGDVIAEAKGLFGLFKSEVRSPIAGAIEYVSDVSGYIGIRAAPQPLEVRAYIDGVVTEVIPEEGATVETRGALVQGIFGVGGERRGPLRMIATAPEQAVDEDDIPPDCQGCVLVGGASASGGALRRAAAAGAAGLVVGAVTDDSLRELVGYDIGVAITGQEELPITLVLTEGFGEIAMAAHTFELLRSLEGKTAAINGATQIRAGVIRPEIIVAHAAPAEEGAGATPQRTAAEGGELKPGARVRIIREPHFGALARVTALPAELQAIETEAQVRVAEVALDSGESAVVPRANLELICHSERSVAE
jgi:hypothetical protein